MENLKDVISKNLVYLRKKNNLTQLELAEKINYSDNAISRWERGEVTPSIEILEILANFYKVSVKDLLEENLSTTMEKETIALRTSRILTVIFSISIVWFVIIIIYIYLGIIMGNYNWTLFIFGVPVSTLLALYFNRRWGNRIISVVLASILAWSLIASIYLSFLEYNLWLIFLLGIPSQSAIISGYFIKPQNEKK